MTGVIFDLDGTLIHQALDFDALRREVGLPPGTPLLEAFAKLPGPEQQRARAILHDHETAAARSAVALPGIAALLQLLDARNLRRAILTRNSRASAMVALAAAGLAGFEPILAREDGPFKPDPAGIHAICSAWETIPSKVLMIGDYHFDVHAGVAAGARTVLVSHGRDWSFAAEADLVIDSFHPLPAELLQWLGSRSI
jgi:HAD superfamily hydrolase (TIGR01509 family)